MGQYRIAALPGDGIGPEVMKVTLDVLRHVLGGTDDLDLQINAYEAGASLYRRTGETLPEDVLHACLDADAMLLAAIGLPDVRRPDGIEVQPEMMKGLRRALGAYRRGRRGWACHATNAPLRRKGTFFSGEAASEQRTPPFRWRITST